MLYNLFENRDFVSVFAVALLAEAWIEIQRRCSRFSAPRVALLAEAWIEIACNAAGFPAAFPSPSSRRAWIEIEIKIDCATCIGVASSRRAWIEIFHGLRTRQDSWVASSRRAWIEINGRKRCKSVKIVALLAEGVDRNNEVGSSLPEVSRRPPRGGRG